MRVELVPPVLFILAMATIGVLVGLRIDGLLSAIAGLLVFAGMSGAVVARLERRLDERIV